MGLQRVSAVGRENAMAQEAKMLAPERRRRIVEMLQSRSPILISEAARELGVSTVTVRGDFDALAAQGMLSRVHGGAVLISDYSFSSQKDRTKGHLREKRAIADRAAELVGDHETILVGSGSTTYELVRALAQRPEASGITVVTNDWHILEQGRREFGSLGLVGTGGTLMREPGYFYGQLLASSLSDVVFDKVFIGANGYDPAFGFLTDLAAACEVKKTFLAHGRNKIVLMDSSKVGEGRSYTRFAKPNEVDMVFVDRDPGGTIASSTMGKVVECCA